MGLQGQISEINVSLRPGADEAAAVAHLTTALGPAVLVSSHEAVNEALSSNLSVARLFARMLSVVTLFVGIFIVYNAIGMTVVERARELGVLRALGATRRQVFSVILVEAVIIGVVGSAAGLALGGLVGRLALRLAAGHEVQCVVTADALLASGLTGILGAVFAGVFPALRAASLDPVDVLRPYASDSPRRRRITAVAGLLLIGLSFLLLYSPLPSATWASWPS
jgi:putative ABC transport system permease protein